MSERTEQRILCIDTEHVPGNVYVMDAEGVVFSELGTLEAWRDDMGAPTADAFAEAETWATNAGLNPCGAWDAAADFYFVSLD